MPALARGPDVAAAFAELAETLASDLDIEKYLTAVCRHCVRLVDAESAAIVYAGDGVGLSEVAASDDRGRVLARGALSAAEGPWRETVRSGQLITIADLPVQGAALAIVHGNGGAGRCPRRHAGSRRAPGR